MASQESFKSKIGFVLAMAGSAVGLGNIWRFPYLAAKNGGGVFLLCYILFAVTIGFALLITELAIGRKFRTSVMGTYRRISPKFGLLGVVATIIPLVVVSGYSVIGGWIIKYFVIFLTGKEKDAAVDGYFSDFMGNAGENAVYFLIFAGLTLVVILLGVQNGIEKINKILMPALLAAIIGIAVYIVTLPGAGAGIKYYLVPDFKGYAFRDFLNTLVAAAGQVFYSLSIALGIPITFGAYMRKEDNIEKSVLQVEIFDFAVAFLAGLIVVPAVFAFSGPESLNAGPGLMFETLPRVFNSMAGGRIIGIAFFLMVIFAAITSSISVMEVAVAVDMETRHSTRRKSSFLVFAAVAVIGMLEVFGNSIWKNFTILGRSIQEFIDYAANSLLVPGLALFTCILIGWIAKTKIVEDEVASGPNIFKTKKAYRIVLKYACPVFLAIILIRSLMG